MSRGKRIAILLAGSKDGFVQNVLLLSAKNIADAKADYHADMNTELFAKWFIQQLSKCMYLSHGKLP